MPVTEECVHINVRGYHVTSDQDSLSPLCQCDRLTDYSGGATSMHISRILKCSNIHEY